MKTLVALSLGTAVLSLPASAWAMHIMEGFLPPGYSLFWLAAVLPFVGLGALKIKRTLRDYPERKLFLGLAAAFVFVLSALKMPSVTGSSSHATGIGLAAILFGPSVAVVIAGIVLVFQALLLAHGGLTTWGANTFSMGLAGGAAAYLTYRAGKAAGLSEKIAVFLAAALGDFATYMMTAIQLAVAFPDPVGGVLLSFGKFAGVFAFTQVPLAVCEGLLSVGVYNALLHYDAQGLIHIWWKEREREA